MWGRGPLCAPRRTHPALLGGLLLVSVCLPAGCRPQKAATPPLPGLSKPTEGFVWLAELMEVHPLYRVARGLGERTAWGAETAGVGAERGGEAGGVLAFPVTWSGVPSGLPGERLSWVASLPAAPEYRPGDLPPDLGATRDWRFRQAENRTAYQLAAAAGEESRRMARLRESLVRGRLSELTNLGLSPRLTPEEAQKQLAEGGEAVWAQIRAKLQIEQTASDRRLVASREQLGAEERAEKALILSEVEGLARQRQGGSMREGRDPRAALLQEMEQVAGDTGGVSAPARTELLQWNSGRAGPDEEASVRAGLTEARRRELQRLREEKGRLLLAIARDTRRTVTGLAYQQRWRLSVVPPADPVGTDLTGIARHHLQQFWAPDVGPRSVSLEETP